MAPREASFLRSDLSIEMTSPREASFWGPIVDLDLRPPPPLLSQSASPPAGMGARGEVVGRGGGGGAGKIFSTLL